MRVGFVSIPPIRIERWARNKQAPKLLLLLSESYRASHRLII